MTGYTDLDIATGRILSVQEPIRHPSAESHLAAYLQARGRACATTPAITNATEAHATRAAHLHHPDTHCEQRRGASLPPQRQRPQNMKGHTVSDYVNEPLATALAWAEGTAHAVPLEGVDIDGAHSAMRVHIECRAWQCPCKADALATLVGAGRIVPDFDRYNL
jgi:hypothetical protein